jgi:signal transduction histidine kinase
MRATKRPMSPPSRQVPDRDALEPDPVVELRRHQAEAALRHRLTETVLAFLQSVSRSGDLPAALGALARETMAAFGAHRAAVWLHDRRERQLTLTAGSEPVIPGPARIPTDDPDAPAARGLRLDRAVTLPDAAPPVIVAPLRGMRRALGTLVIEGPSSDALRDVQFDDLADLLGQQLGAAIEGVQLLDEILRQRLLLEDTFNALLDLVVVTDGRGRIVQMNDAFATRVRAAREDIVDRELGALVGGELGAWASAAPEGDAVRTLQVEAPELGGTFLATITPLVNREGQPSGRVLVARDITRQTRLEREQEALRERLGRSEKLASLGQFVAGIAHEMNNPLQGVLGHLELIIDTADLPAGVKHDLRGVYREANRAARIVKNLLAFTGSHRAKRRRLRLERVLSRALSSRAASLRRKNIEVVPDLPDDLPFLDGDPLLLHQAFLNIIINAEHAMGPGGRLEVQARREDTGMLVATVRDSGPGIDPEIIPRIFDPFFTTKAVGEGTGLGLAITYGIIREHGGSIHAANAEGGGAEFIVELPAAQQK